MTQMSFPQPWRQIDSKNYPETRDRAENRVPHADNARKHLLRSK